MTWCGIEGHDDVAALFRQSLVSGRLASTFLFVGLPGIGKRTFAQRLAQALLCETHVESELNPCQNCDACRQIVAGSHPDVSYVQKPVDRTVLPVELFIGDLEHRGREGLCRWIALKPLRGRRRVAIIDDADYFNEASANCLLKTLEEPPANSVLLLIGTSAQRQLPTIRSRCQIVRFRPLSESFVREFVVDQGMVDSEVAAEEIACLSEGSLEYARQLADPDLSAFRCALWEQLSPPAASSIVLTAFVKDFVEAAGKETRKRRDRLRHVIQLFMLYFRQAMYRENNAKPPTRSRLADVDISGPGRDEMPSSSESRLDRCLDALSELSANANIATLIECWIDDLFHSSAIARTN